MTSQMNARGAVDSPFRSPQDPGLRALRISHGAVNAAAGTSPYYFVAELMFDSMAAIQSGLASPEGQATAADLQNFADGGVTLLMYETEDA
jgi:uncharacterized protein (TIGR02118 family)